MTTNADRDHCLLYMAAVPLIFANLTAEHYEDSFHAANPVIDQLREKMEMLEATAVHEFVARFLSERHFRGS